MRPAPAEELAASASILASLVGTEAAGEFVRGQLRHVVEVMDGLEADWDRALPRLEAECAATEAFLRDLAARLEWPPPPAGGRAERATGAIDLANARHQQLRGELVEAISALYRAEETAGILAGRRMVRAFLLKSSTVWTG